MSLFHSFRGERIARRITRTVALFAGVLAIAAAAPPRLHAQQRPLSTSAHDVKAARATRKQLGLVNTTKDTVTLELRLGDAADCAANPTATTQRVPPGREWLIASGRPICWRRSDANASPGVSSWHRHVLKAGDYLKLSI